MSQDRRNFIKLASLASVALIPSAGLLLESFGKKDIASPKRRTDALRIEPTRLVDAHIHLFNVRYLPLKGIIRNVPIIKVIAGPIAKFLYALTDDFDMDTFPSAPDGDGLKNMPPGDLIAWFIDRTSNKLNDIANKSAPNQIDRSFEQSLLLTSISELAEEMNKEQKTVKSFNRTGFRKKFIEQYKRVNSVTADKSAQAALENMYGNPIRWALRKLSTPEADADLQQYFDCDGIPVINFLAVMLANEAKIYRQATRGYGNANLALQVHYMMDMHASYRRGATYYPFHPVQTSNMMTLVNNSNGKLLGFTAFNPKNNNAMQSFQDGIKAGNIGVKFYPPMGYLPYGDCNAGVRNKVSEFFKYCEEEQIPVFTHCTPVGFQAKKGYGLNSNPDHWRKVLEIHPNLRVCFGHAGGGDPKVQNHHFHGWYSTPQQWLDDDCYARKVVELCEEFPNAYCEVAHLGNIISNAADRERFTNNLVGNFDRKKQYKLKDKICFGTDWHMIGMINEQQHYYDALVNIFQAPSLQGSIEKFFSENFIAFLNITRFLSNRESEYLSVESCQYLKSLLA